MRLVIAGKGHPQSGCYENNTSNPHSYLYSNYPAYRSDLSPLLKGKSEDLRLGRTEQGNNPCTEQAGGEDIRRVGEKDGKTPLSAALRDRTTLKFHTRERRAKESIATFVAELRALGQTCRFSDSLEDMIHDRLVCGVKDERMHRRLLAERETRIDFKRALELANMVEAAEKNSRELQSRASAENQP